MNYSIENLQTAMAIDSRGHSPESRVLNVAIDPWTQRRLNRIDGKLKIIFCINQQRGKIMNYKQWIVIGVTSAALVAIAMHHTNNPPLITSDYYPRILAVVVAICSGIAGLFLLGNKRDASGKAWHSAPDTKDADLSPTTRIAIIGFLSFLVVCNAVSLFTNPPTSPTGWLVLAGPIVVLPCVLVSVALGVIKDLKNR